MARCDIEHFRPQSDYGWLAYCLVKSLSNTAPFAGMCRYFVRTMWTPAL